MNKNVIRGIVESMDSHFMFVKLENKCKGRVHVSEISDFYIRDISNLFEIGAALDFKILEEKKIGNRTVYELSFKSNHPWYRKNPFEFKMASSEKSFQDLLNNTIKHIEEWNND